MCVMKSIIVVLENKCSSKLFDIIKKLQSFDWEYMLIYITLHTNYDSVKCTEEKRILINTTGMPTCQTGNLMTSDLPKWSPDECLFPIKEHKLSV